MDRSSDWVQPLPEPINELATLAQQLREGNGTQSLEELLKYAKGRDPYLSDAALTAIAKSSGTWTIDFLTKLPASDRLWCLVALRRVDLKEEKWVRAVWLDHVPAIRFEALRWIADGVLTSFSADVENCFNSKTSTLRFLKPHWRPSTRFEEIQERALPIPKYCCSDFATLLHRPTSRASRYG